jgi:electron transport complex protein RnfC
MPDELDDIPQPSSTRPQRERTWPREAPAFRAIERVGTVYVPLTRELASDPLEAKPIGTPVARGERLTSAAPEATHAALSPVAGRMRGIDEITLLNGNRAQAVVVEPDSIDAAVASTLPPSAASSPNAPAHAEQERVLNIIRSIKSTDLSAWTDRLRAAGIWADRRTSPDLVGQLHAAMRRPVDTIVCSLLDVDSTVCLNAALGARAPWQLTAGVALLAAAVGARQAMIVTDMDAPGSWSSAIRRLRNAWRVQVVPVRNDYPQSDPTLLLYALLHRRLRPGRLPVEQGAIQLDAAAAVAIGRLLYEEAPMLSVPFVLRDRVRGATYFLDVPIGASLVGVLGPLGITTDEMVFRAGEMLRDQRVPPNAIIAGGELIIDAALRDRVVRADPCIRCGWCMEMCPTRVQPAGVLEAAQRDDWRLAEHHGIESCIECGICSYVCPSHLPLIDGVRILRARGSAL